MPDQSWYAVNRRTGTKTESSVLLQSIDTGLDDVIEFTTHLVAAVMANSKHVKAPGGKVKKTNLRSGNFV